MVQSDLKLGTVTVWLRQDAAQPKVYSARFRIVGGCGWFRWPYAAFVEAPVAVSSGTAGGLHAEDALGLLLRFKVGGELHWRDLRVAPGGVPMAVGHTPGKWVELPVSAEQSVDEPTDVTASAAVDDLSTENLPFPVTPSEEDDDEIDLILEPVETLPGKPKVASRGGSALVRSLVTRIRQQETEIAALKRRILELEAG